MSLIFTVLVIGSAFLSFAQEPSFRTRLHQLDTEYSEEDIQVEIEFGRNLAARILGTYQLYDNQKVQEYINLLGTGIAAQIGRPELTYYFAILDTKEVNAYACPGGYIFLTKGALKLMTDEAQLVGVIAHEIWHVNFRHVVKPLRIRAKGDSLTSGIAAIVGSSTATARVLLNQLTEKAYKLLFEEGISQQSELDTDSAAIETLLTLNYNWKSYREYVESIEKNTSSNYRQVLSKTHPNSADRLESLDNLALSLQINDLKGKTNAKRFQSYLQSL